MGGGAGEKSASATASRFGNWGGFGNWPGLGNCPWIRQLLDLATALDSTTGALARFGNCGSGFANRTGFRNCCLRQLATGYQPPASQPLEGPGAQGRAPAHLWVEGLGLGWALGPGALEFPGPHAPAPLVSLGPWAL